MKADDGREFNAICRMRIRAGLTVASSGDYFAAAEMLISNRLHCLLLPLRRGPDRGPHTKLAATFDWLVAADSGHRRCREGSGRGA